VLQADGGTRTAAITGAFVAAQDAVNKLMAAGKLAASPVLGPVAAISVGIVEGTPLLDLEYVEDVACDTDMNVVMTGAGHFVEVQGTAEGAAFTRAEMDELLRLAEKGIGELVAAAAGALASVIQRNSSSPPTTRASSPSCRPCSRRWASRWCARASWACPRPRSRTAPSSRTRWPRRATAQHTGLPAIADDAGLCVDAFGGLPGVDTAYYATQFGYPKGDDNNVKALLEQMRDVPNRRAALVSTLVAVRTPRGPRAADRGGPRGRRDHARAARRAMASASTR
jgi:hypothetical protein